MVQPKLPMLPRAHLNVLTQKASTPSCDPSAWTPNRSSFTAGFHGLTDSSLESPTALFLG